MVSILIINPKFVTIYGFHKNISLTNRTLHITIIINCIPQKLKSMIKKKKNNEVLNNSNYDFLKYLKLTSLSSKFRVSEKFELA